MNNKNPIYNIIKDTLVCHKEDPLVIILFYSIDWTIQGKFGCLKQVLENPFINLSLQPFLSIFMRIQRIHFAIHRFIWIWRYKRAKTYNTEDLFMTPISDGQKGTITILENNTKYIFLVRELMNSIQTNLSNCSHFFPDIKPCKNPYTNIPLKKSNLYNIYFKIRESFYKISPLLEGFFRESFDLKSFSKTHSFLINEEYLDQYSKTNININNILACVNELFESHKIVVDIHKDFPRYRLIEIMLPYIDLYNKSQYYMNTNKSDRAFRTLHNKLHRFFHFNPHFGRQKIEINKKYIVSKNKWITEKNIRYNDNHPLFEEPTKVSFMKTHTDIIYEIHHRQLYSTISSNRQINIVINNDSEDSDDEEEPELLSDDEISETNTPILHSPLNE